MAFAFPASASLALLSLFSNWGDTTYTDNFNSIPDLTAYAKDDDVAALRAWHWDRAMALWPEQRRLQQERYLLTLSIRKGGMRSAAQPRHSYVVRHRSRQVRLYI